MILFYKTSKRGKVDFPEAPWSPAADCSSAYHWARGSVHYSLCLGPSLWVSDTRPLGYTSLHHNPPRHLGRRLYPQPYCTHCQQRNPSLGPLLSSQMCPLLSSQMCPLLSSQKPAWLYMDRPATVVSVCMQRFGRAARLHSRNFVAAADLCSWKRNFVFWGLQNVVLAVLCSQSFELFVQLCSRSFEFAVFLHRWAVGLL